TLRLDQRTRANGMTGAWSLRDAPAGAALAVNAGQFMETGPWGWLVIDGRELSYPGRGPLAMAVATDSAGTVHWLPDRRLPAHRGAALPVTAFQSYPVLVDPAGVVPPPLRRGTAIDLQHRDIRLAMGRLGDGRILFVLTRFARAGRLLERLPAGLTVPETAALMGALGARPALMLDGGLSAQLLVRDSTGTALQWPGTRLVPLALTATAVY
ncbi:MAG TPA: phosphodiester glycosidase family protein, partial [Longimicrobiales bacterium]|nr:phosphodiester glycosidase family protein [Longimicrobiales bacterium]